MRIFDSLYTYSACLYLVLKAMLYEISWLGSYNIKSDCCKNVIFFQKWQSRVARKAPKRSTHVRWRSVAHQKTHPTIDFLKQKPYARPGWQHVEGKMSSMSRQPTCAMSTSWMKTLRETSGTSCSISPQDESLSQVIWALSFHEWYLLKFSNLPFFSLLVVDSYNAWSQLDSFVNQQNSIGLLFPLSINVDKFWCSELLAKT